MLIYKVTYRHYYGACRPYEFSDLTVNYFSSIEKARECVKDFLGSDAKCDDDFGFDVWTSNRIPHTEYLIDAIKVY